MLLLEKVSDGVAMTSAGNALQAQAYAAGIAQLLSSDRYVAGTIKNGITQFVKVETDGV